MENAGFAKTLDILSGKIPDGKRITMAGLISQFKVRQLKNNNILASGQIEDIYSAVNITVFHKTYEQYKELLLGTEPVIITARVSEREDRDTELICEKLEPMPQSAKNAKRTNGIKKGLYVKIPSADSPLINELKEILGKYKGDNPVYIVCADDNRRLAAPKTLFVRHQKELLDEISAIFGENNVKFVN